MPIDKPKPLDFEISNLIDEPMPNEPIGVLEEHIHLLDDDPLDSDGNTMFDKPLWDVIIHAEVLLPQGENMQSAKVKGCAKDILIGSYNSNPLLNLMLYDMEFPDGQIKQYGANVITENMYSQVNEEGYSTTIIDSINDYQKESNTIAMSQKFAHTTKSGQKQA
jgi:hypothetical protein